MEADIERMEADAAWENQEMDQKMSARRHRRLSAADRPQYSAVIRTGKRAGAAAGGNLVSVYDGGLPVFRVLYKLTKVKN